MAVELRYSGGSGNKFAETSLGGVMSSEVIPDNDPQNLFDDVNRVEVINGRTEYRMFYLYNNTSNNYMKTKGFKIVIPVNTEISFAVDNNDSPQLLSTEDSVPNGLAFFNVDEWLGLTIALGLLNASEGVPIWIRRKVLEGSGDPRIIDIEFDGETNSLTFSQDFYTHKNSFDNFFIKNRSTEYLTDVDFIGEALLS